MANQNSSGTLSLLTPLYYSLLLHCYTASSLLWSLVLQIILITVYNQITLLCSTPLRFRNIVLFGKNAFFFHLQYHNNFISYREVEHVCRFYEIFLELYEVALLSFKQYITRNIPQIFVQKIYDFVLYLLKSQSK